MGETPMAWYKRIAASEPPGKDATLFWIRQKLWQFCMGQEKRATHMIQGVLPLNTCIAALNGFGMFVNQCEPGDIVHILKITDQKRLERFCAFQARCMPHAEWIQHCFFLHFACTCMLCACRISQMRLAPL